MDASDSDLVARALSGERAAFGELIERHRPMALRLALRLLDDPAEAEDAAQEASLQAFLSLSRLRHPERFSAWLNGIVVNLCRLQVRARRDTYALEDWQGGRVADGFTLAEAEPSPEAASAAHDLHRRVLDAIALLPPEQQAVVRLHYLEGLTLAEIGALAGRPLGTVKAQLHRARERLRAGPLRELGLAILRKESMGMIEVEIQDVVMRAPKPPLEGVAGAEAVRRPLPPGFTPEADVIFFKGDEKGPQFFTRPLPPSFVQRVVVLKEKAGGRILPIWIGPHEADMLALQLGGGSVPRPLTFDLMLRLLETARARLERVTIHRLHEEVFYSTLELQIGGQAHSVDARPSDALNLAVRAKAPIFVDESVLAAAGIAADKLEEKLNEEKPGEPEAGSQDTAQFMWVKAPPPNLSRPAPGTK